MAVLSKEDRIAMSKKIVAIPEELATVEVVKAQIEAARQEAIKNDAVNEALQTPYDEKIHAYQKEHNLIDGRLRSEITEDIINNAAKGVNRNGFFLADPEFPIPTVPGGVWTAFAPMAFTYAIGKFNNEQYQTESLGEQPTINTINGLISQIEAFVDATRASGQKCIESGFCTGMSLPPEAQDGPTECSLAGGSWTITEIVVNSPEIQSLLSQLKSQIQIWENSLNSQKNNVQIGDSDVAARQTQNQTAYDKLDPLLAILNGWQAVRDFDTTTNLPDDCDAFDSMGYRSFCVNPDNPTPPKEDQFSCEFDNGIWVESFKDSKLSPTQIGILKDAIAERSPFLTERVTQLNSYFGAIQQDTEGNLISQSGWYGARYLILDSRLNIISGSANGKFGAEEGLKTQDKIESSIETTAAAYGLTMKATIAAAPGLDTPYLNVKDASEFKVGDSVYVVANDQEEFSGELLEKKGNRVKLSFNIPKKYTPLNKTRLYKLVDTPI